MTYTTIQLMDTTFWVEFEESRSYGFFIVTIMDWLSDNEYLNEHHTLDMGKKIESDLEDEIIIQLEKRTLDYQYVKYEQLRTGDITI